MEKEVGRKREKGNRIKKEDRDNGGGGLLNHRVL